ncbi:prolipoprotein diacylglyceryl transferase [Streptomyces sp. 3MP-14]|uniref:Phosphatidylglycerol--prolipoprotein diacylglyceryl transferase n=1 Tax=Streptomyces mimosae TaxID=2586635 RepID=A0A5N6ALZ9_9ACTN|nr:MULTISPECIES: prolipoprotein diacylglyceryl transferase [Streptomyces]KAB8168729.1 prolipoprotein diacylglyceryl transferase [Streptomyces mimosae]KAB8177991.1 prolipoprotein diacylglyceryl transferase [Streptomyces sp. 3MP-14]
MEILAAIPSPGTSEIELGPLPLRGYALCIIIGVFLAIWLGGRRWVQRGGQPGTVADIAVWAVPFGLIGARIYHVVTDNQLYFGEGRDPVDAFKIWDGGIGIWGAIAGGAFGAWIACRRRGIALPPMADAIAPGIAFAQAIGRWGNWFNQELYGRETDLPWAVEIDNGLDTGTFHPTFLYESLWCLGVGLLVIWADRRFRLGHGRAFALYVAAYTVGRFWIEYLRIDEAHEFLGLRLNNWTSIVVFLAAVAYLVLSARSHPGREENVEPRPDGEDGSDADGSGAEGAEAEADGGAAGAEDAEPSSAEPSADGEDAKPGKAQATTLEKAKPSAEPDAEESADRSEETADEPATKDESETAENADEGITTAKSAEK